MESIAPAQSSPRCVIIKPQWVVFCSRSSVHCMRLYDYFYFLICQIYFLYWYKYTVVVAVIAVVVVIVQLPLCKAFNISEKLALGKLYVFLKFCFSGWLVVCLSVCLWAHVVVNKWTVEQMITK